MVTSDYLLLAMIVDDYAKVYAKYIHEPNDLIPDKPQAIYPDRSNERLLAQKGLFTIHGKLDSQMEITCGDCIEKIEIPESLIPKLQHILKYFGVNAFSVYPDLKGLSQYMKESYNFS